MRENPPGAVVLTISQPGIMAAMTDAGDRLRPGHAAGPGPADTHTGLVLRGLARAGDRPAIRHGAHSLTARQVLAAVHRTARGLIAHGLVPGDGIAVLAGNRPQAVIVRLAANLAGCRIAMLHTDRGTVERLAIALDALPAALVFDPGPYGRDAALLAHALPGLTLLPLGPGDGPADLPPWAAGRPAGPLAPRYRPDGVMAIRYTSGSTGKPKGVVRRFARPPRPPLLSAAAFLLCTPLHHGGGTTADLALAAGGTLVLQDGFAEEAVLEAVARERITRVYLPPHLLYRLLDHPALGRTDLSSLRRVTYTGCPALPERLTEATRRLGAVLHQTYSLTECGPVTRLGPREHLDPRLLTTAGRPLPDSGIRITDERGRPLPPGRTGRICVRTPTAMPGYWRNPALTAETLQDGWLHTGDLGRLDRQGYLTVTGRTGTTVVVDGTTVHPRDVEEPLRAHPAVREAVMFSGTGPGPLARVHAAVVTVPGAMVNADELRAWVRAHSGPHCAPSAVLLLPGIPLTGTGKPDLTRLRRLADRLSDAPPGEA